MTNRIIATLFFCCVHHIVFAAKRQKILFINQAPEMVYVAIHLEPSEPFDREAVPFRGRKYFFPEVIDEDNFYYITIRSASQEVRYTLHLYGNLTMSSARACRAYGELQLMRQDLVVQTLNAASIAQGLVFTYSLNFELQVGLAYITARPHQPLCRQQHYLTGACICSGQCARVSS
jgi:hypothetical protein